MHRRHVGFKYRIVLSTALVCCLGISWDSGGGTARGQGIELRFADPPPPKVDTSRPPSPTAQPVSRQVQRGRPVSATQPQPTLPDLHTGRREMMPPQPLPSPDLPPDQRLDLPRQNAPTAQQRPRSANIPSAHHVPTGRFGARRSRANAEVYREARHRGPSAHREVPIRRNDPRALTAPSHRLNESPEVNRVLTPIPSPNSVVPLSPFHLHSVLMAQLTEAGNQDSADNQSSGPATLSSDDTNASVSAAAAKITQAVIDERAERAKNNKDLSDEDKSRIADLYSTARSNLDRAQQFEQRAQEFQQKTEAAQKQAEKNKALLQTLEKTRPERPKTQVVTEIEKTLTTQKQQLHDFKDRKLELDEKVTTRASRRNAVQKRMAELEAATQKAVAQATAPPGDRESPSISRARQTEALSNYRAALAEQPALQQELTYLDTESSLGLLQSERSVVARSIDLWQEQIALTESALDNSRRIEAGSAVESATDAEDSVPPALRPIAEKTLRYAENSQRLANQIRAATKKLESVTKKYDEINEANRTTRHRVESVDLTASVGALLRNQRAHLPNTKSLRNSCEDRQTEIDKTQLAIFDLDELRSQLNHIDFEAHFELERLAPNKALVTPENLTIAKSLLEARRDVLDSLYRNQTSYFTTLTKISFQEEQLASLSDEFRKYIEKHVLWIRSNPPLHLSFTAQQLRTELEAKRGLLEWPEIGPALAADAASNPMVYFLSVLGMGLLVVVRPFLSSQLRRIATRTRSSAYSYFGPSLLALGINLLSSLFGPMLFCFLSWRFSIIREPADLTNALSIGFRDGAAVLFPITFFARVFAKDGLADAHFDWPKNATQKVRKSLIGVRLILPAAVFVGSVVYSLQGSMGSGIFERSLFVVVGITMAFFTWQLLHPQRGLPSDYLQQNEGSWIERLKDLWFWFVVAIPLSLCGLTISGFTYTAVELAGRYFSTLSILGGILVLHGLCMRLLLVHRRRLSIEAARLRYAEYQRKIAEEAKEQEKKKALAEQGDGDAQPESSESAAQVRSLIADLPGVSVTSDGIVMEDDPLGDLRSNSAQSRRLVTTLLSGATVVLIWLTWRDVIPALSFFDRWPLWNSTRVVTDVVTNDAELSEIRTHEEAVPVTIPDLMFAFLALTLGTVAARDLPGLLELAILKRLPLENSVRYAITTISSYAIFFVGLFVACRSVGLKWEQIQWMATALTFGLAFGLQEVFANFVAGIILLFERPIRVGDIVTLDEVTGVISRVRMRATTITNFDRKDYIVPNKDFITGRLLNWTLSDKVNRVVVNVGIAYGSDVELAKRLIVEVAKNHSTVVDDPAPIATFEEFGESSLNLVLRCFIAMNDMPMRLDVIDQLHSRIDAKFREAQIEIAFPQTDIHIRDLPPLRNASGPGE